MKNQRTNTESYEFFWMEDVELENGEFEEVERCTELEFEVETFGDPELGYGFNFCIVAENGDELPDDLCDEAEEKLKDFISEYYF